MGETWVGALCDEHPVCPAGTLRQPMPLTRLPGQHRRTHGRRWSCCARPPAERAPRAPCQGCPGGEHCLPWPLCLLCAPVGSRAWPKIRAPFPASPSELQKWAAGGREFTGMSEGCRWRVSSSLEGLLPTSQPSILLGTACSWAKHHYMCEQASGDDFHMWLKIWAGFSPRENLSPQCHLWSDLASPEPTTVVLGLSTPWVGCEQQP